MKHSLNMMIKDWVLGSPLPPTKAAMLCRLAAPNLHLQEEGMRFMYDEKRDWQCGCYLLTVHLRAALWKHLHQDLNVDWQVDKYAWDRQGGSDHKRSRVALTNLASRIAQLQIEAPPENQTSILHQHQGIWSVLDRSHLLPGDLCKRIGQLWWGTKLPFGARTRT